MPSSSLDLTVRVTARRREAEDIVSLELRDPSGATLPSFEAGAHIDVHVTDTLVRPYSLCNDPGESHRYLIAVLREPGSRGGSAAVHDALREGALVRVGRPRNLFALQAANRSLLLAGGIGVTPIVAMAEQLHREGADFSLHYAARSAARMAFRERLQSAPYAARCQLHFDDGEPAQRFNAARVLAEPAPDQRLYVCGPVGFIDHVVASARLAGWPDDRVHVERFSAPATMAGADTGFRVRIASSGAELEVPVGRSVVNVLEEGGFAVPVSCEQGVCGTCLMRVLQGVPDHRDCYLTDDEKSRNDQFTPCCSRSLTPVLVLDL